MRLCLHGEAGVCTSNARGAGFEGLRASCRGIVIDSIFGASILTSSGGRTVLCVLSEGPTPKCPLLPWLRGSWGPEMGQFDAPPGPASPGGGVSKTKNNMNNRSNRAAQAWRGSHHPPPSWCRGLGQARSVPRLQRLSQPHAQTTAGLCMEDGEKPVPATGQGCSEVLP